MTTLSRSNLAHVDFRQKWRQAIALLTMRRDKASRKHYIEGILTQIDGMRSTYERHTGRAFAEARVLDRIRRPAVSPHRVDEHGHPGPRHRPRHADASLQPRGIDQNSGKKRVRARNENRRPQPAFRPAGLRDLKSATRTRSCDARQHCRPSRRRRRHLRLRNRTARSRLFTGRLEHIPREGIENILSRLATRLAPNGLALITPNIFTGITGGHLPEWYWDSEDNISPRRSEPWEHLRKKRFQANTWLNGLSRRDYRELFRRHFEILEENVQEPNLGRHRLTPDIKAELAQWPDEELFSNTVEFVLRPRSSATST